MFHDSIKVCSAFQYFDALFAAIVGLLLLFFDDNNSHSEIISHRAKKEYAFIINATMRAYIAPANQESEKKPMREELAANIIINELKINYYKGKNLVLIIYIY